ncbi:TetM/TetW/TetO/TetS family tetracycline resistance ribosomal protection protein [Paenibacillus sp. MWE-103]|uniref:TetM/TetW/TetO/TetS family tetracycline resistance ribosomal protection protein n=1 Tax=Paenibacillus artemisiicola TaxID=1172618 RepID=A0ABS3WEU6_9BACL|nr:TetM/TetW/TetO/TetS family tetracycline resistance ribosomal protection protein [Paenibacillus artemisiicola]MBO7746842.1 TetM/TetW/TetO/TetS family tetracycline resistance ribosomal protection protein [Paenibacillus artemisiicola]
MKITIGMFAHVDAGKTTLAEQLLYHTRSIRERGRVDHKDAYLDSHEIERARGITVFADQAVITYEGDTYYLVDTPGHVDFSPEMERAIRIMDYAILVVSAAEGVQGHTETVWQLLRKHRVPTFFFLNKTDRTGADPDRALAEIRAQLTPDACPLTGSFAGSEIGEALRESLAERDEALLEAFLAGAGDAAFWLEALRRLIRECRLYPCMSGSALQDVGVTEFLERLHALTVTAYDERAPFGGRAYKIRHDASGARVTYVKALSGELKVRDELFYGAGEARTGEKATRLLLVNGSKTQAVDRVAAGDLFAVVGLSGAETGEGLGACADRIGYELVPTLTSKVVFAETLNAKEVLKAFRMLNAEDPSLGVVWEESLQEIHIRVMGVIQLEVLRQLAKDRFGLDVAFGAPEILYKETIQSTVRGYGHFEPLRHYAEVHLLLEPGERGSGLTFVNACHADDLSVGNQNVIRTHLFERDHHGLLTGMPLTDVRITLLTGAGHNEHTHGGDFREAAFRALRQGLEKAENVLLEPYYAFKIRVELDELGRALSDIQRASGQFEPPATTASHAVVTGRVPVATFMEYGAELAAYTHGKGTLRLVFDGYDRCHDEREVIARKAYRKDADPLYSSSSIFCAKGHGYTVPWDEAEAKMHLL